MTNAFDQVAQIINAIGTFEFSGRLADFLQTHTVYDSLVISAFFANHPPKQMFSNLSTSDAERTTAPYFEYAYLLDPWFLMFSDGVQDGVYRLAECVPDEFMQSEYFQEFYSRTGLREECGIFINIDDDVCLVLSLGRRIRQTPEENIDSDFLNIAFECTRSLCRRHWPSVEPDDLEGKGRLGAHIKGLAGRFGSHCLSEREREIVHLILRGHSNKSMARALEISPETVKVYRKRVHTKLNISSQGELFSMFLAALAMIPVGSSEDPLEIYFRKLASDGLAVTSPH